MDTRFNSFHMEQVPPYVQAMTELLSESGLRAYRPWWYATLIQDGTQKFDENNKLVHQLVAEVIARRRANPSGKKDLVGAMLNGSDPKTGKKLTDDIIIDNMITFLIAGVYSYTGNSPFKALGKLAVNFICHRARDDSRLVVIFSRHESNPEVPVVLGQKWEIKSGQTMVIVNRKLHRDTTAPSHSLLPQRTILMLTLCSVRSKVWGEDAEEFKPERILGENFTKLLRNSLKVGR